MNRERWRGRDGSTSHSRIRRCPRQAALHGSAQATRPKMECPQRHRASTHHLTQWRVIGLYGAQWRRRRRRCREECVLWDDRPTGSSKTQSPPTPPMSAPGALARRLWGVASVNHMPATSPRDQSTPNKMARHRTLRRAVASATAKMPRRLCILGLTDQKCRDAKCATPPMSAPGGLARRFWGNASADGMPATSSRSINA